MKPKTTTGQPVPSKRQLSRWEKESKKRRILALVIAAAIIAAGSVIGVGLYNTKVKPWHQAIVKVNGKVFDMDYFVKMLRLYGLEEDYVSYYASYMVQNELVRQEAERLGIDVTDEEIEAELQSQFGFDPDSEDDDAEFNQQLKEFLEERNISRKDIEKMAILPSLLKEKVTEAMGNEEYPTDSLYDHAHVKAVLVGTREEAQTIKGNWNGDFNQIIKDYSPTIYYPEGGYWLVMVYEPEEAEETEEEGLYIKAMLLATEEKAEEVAGKFTGNNFAELAGTYSLDSSGEDGGDMGWLSLDTIELTFGDLDTIQDLEINTLSDPISGNYPDEAVEWLPAGILSSVFDEFALAEGYDSRDVSDPILDTTYATTGGYWLVMTYEPEEEEREEEEEGLYIKAILLDSEETAEALKADIDADGDFATLAEEHSLDSSGADGGDIGWLSLDDIEAKFGEDNLATIQGLELDTLSEPLDDEDVSKQSGYWVIEVLERADRTLIEEHRDTFISEYYSEWIEAAMETGIESYLDDEKLSWAAEHI